MADSKYFGPNSFKKIDIAYKLKYYNHPIDWPILVIESRLSKKLAYLRVDTQ